CGSGNSAGNTAAGNAGISGTPGQSGQPGPAGSTTPSKLITSVFKSDTENGKAIPCLAQPKDGVRVCHGDEAGSAATDLRFKSFDGSALDVYVTLPPAPKTGIDGNYPLIVQNHGWGDPPSGPTDAQYAGPTAEQWAEDGYVVLQFAARGWGDSCGNLASRLANPPACTDDYIHLDDYRYEARDVQYAVGLLVDDGIVNPQHIGVTGESYGAGLSYELATLKDRMMLPSGALEPWQSPDGTPLQIAAAAPQYGWTDLAYALAPNGRTLANKVTRTTADLDPVGVEKLTIVDGLYATGVADGQANFGLGSIDNLTIWLALINLGEPYNTPADTSMVQQIAHYHSAYYLLAGAYGMKQEAPPPLFMTNGFTDDIFPVDEALRYYNLVRKLYPSVPMSLFFYDGGHQRGSNKPADGARVVARVKAFFDYYLKGIGPQPPTGVTTLTQTCPQSAPSGGPYEAASWAAIHPGVVVYTSKPAQTVLSVGGNPLDSTVFDPVGATEVSAINKQSMACQTAPAGPELGVATYALPTPTGSGYTLLGAPTVTADFQVIGVFPYIAARLVDVNPETNTETLVARGVYRFDPQAPDGTQTFQLFPAGWHFAPGHIPELQLLGLAAPYLRPTNGVFSITVSNLQLKLPVHEVPGGAGVPTSVQPNPDDAAPKPTATPSIRRR
ncbi:MAG TPA: CocE/NonD family hydrolase, partial [Nevskiaceae bacterium]|nr:CocE/NonD family hydrolase [Nevskiaceae bacterium]